MPRVAAARLARNFSSANGASMYAAGRSVARPLLPVCEVRNHQTEICKLAGAMRTVWPLLGYNRAGLLSTVSSSRVLEPKNCTENRGQVTLFGYTT